MHDLINAFVTPGVSQTLLALSLTALGGILLGKISFGNVRIGIAGALFFGLFIGALGLESNHEVLHFVKEFGLILFVFAIGMQVGPGFFSSLRQEGILLNLLALLVIAGNVVAAITVFYLMDFSLDAMVGVMSGAITNTPGLGAAQQVIAEQAKAGVQLSTETAGMAYAVAYPFGIIGVILAMVLIRILFKVSPEEEHKKFIESRRSAQKEPIARNVELRNQELSGRTYSSIIQLAGDTLVIPRRLRGGVLEAPLMDDRAQVGDILLAVGSPEHVDRLKMIAGGEAGVDLRKMDEDKLISRKVMITRQKVTRKTLRELNLTGRHRATIVRIYRAGIVFTATPERYLHVGDMVTLVAPAANIQAVLDELGNAPESLNHPNLLPIFLGIFLGVLVGSISLTIPGVPAPVKLGLAGGPLVIALLMGWIGKVGPINFYQTPGANMILKELGILLFLACVGLGSGKNFIPSFVSGDGFYWLLGGLFITFPPVFLVGAIARLKGMNYLTLIGTLAGANTNPPALEYANSIYSSPAQAIGYAGVYPLTMLMRVMVAQLFVIMLI